MRIRGTPGSVESSDIVISRPYGLSWVAKTGVCAAYARRLTVNVIADSMTTSSPRSNIVNISSPANMPPTTSV